MLLGFKRRFAPYVLDGSKTHTIRALREDGKIARVGETLHCYVDPRQKTMALLGRWECAKVQEISISQLWLVMIDDQPLTVDECQSFAFADGFRTFLVPGKSSYLACESPFTEMMRFWNGRLPFKGSIIHWHYTQNTRNPKWRDILKRIEGKQ